MTERIMICAMNYAPEFTGAGRYTGEIGAFLVAQGHDVCVVTTPPHYPQWAAGEGYSNKRWSRETVQGAEVYRCPLYLDRKMGGFKRLLAPFTYALGAAPVILWQAVKRRPKVILVVEPTLLVAPVAQFAARLVGAEVVLHVQDLEIDAALAVGHLPRRGLSATVAVMFERSILRRFDRLITISNRMAERLVEKGVSPDRIRLVRNWVDLAAFRKRTDISRSRAELDLPASAFVVAYAGALGAKQGVGLLIEAANQLKQDGNIVLIIAGEGPMRPRLEAAALCCANLKLLGFQPESRFPEFLKMVDLHVLPQERDAADLVLPSKLGGMLASGRPILVTADPGTELAMFLGDCCHLTPPGDVEALVAAIRMASAESKEDPVARQGRIDRASFLSRDHAIALFGDCLLGLAGEAGVAEVRMAAEWAAGVPSRNPSAAVERATGV